MSRLRRRYFRFSLRGLLVATTLFGIWLGVHVKSAREQAAAVAEIHSHEATLVGYEQSVPWPRWLTDSLGEDFFYRAVSVQRAPARALPAVARLPHLEYLTVSDWHTTDDSLAQIKHLRQLRTLDVHVDSYVTFIGARHVTRVTDRSLRMIGQLPRIQDVTVAGHCFTDDGLRALCRARRLRRVYLTAADNRITPEGLAKIKALPHLEDVGVWGFGDFRQVDLVQHFKHGQPPLAGDDDGELSLVDESPFPSDGEPDPR